jgi:hypothetical protein
MSKQLPGNYQKITAETQRERLMQSDFTKINYVFLRLCGMF